jgi:hypothetical protein
MPVRLTEGDLVRQKAPAVWPMFWTYVAVIVASSLVAEFVFGKDDVFPALVFAMLSVFVVTCIYSALYWRSLAVQFKVFGLNRSAALVGLLAVFPLLGINYLIYLAVQQLGLKDPLDSGEVQELGGAFLFCAFCVFPAVTEEIAFRGLIQQWLSTAIKPLRAILLASFLFAALHASIISLPYLFLVGMLLGWVKWRTNSLYPSMLIHLVHNWVVLDFF